MFFAFMRVLRVTSYYPYQNQKRKAIESNQALPLWSILVFLAVTLWFSPILFLVFSGAYALTYWRYKYGQTAL